jgi:hypothetical protein
MLSKVTAPKTKAELVRAIQGADVRSFEVLEGAGLDRLPSKADLVRMAATVIVLRGR